MREDEDFLLLSLLEAAVEVVISELSVFFVEDSSSSRSKDCLA